MIEFLLQISFHQLNKTSLLSNVSMKKQLYLGSTNFGKEAQLYLQHDNQNHILHMMPFTFSNFSVDRILVYLANQNPIPILGNIYPRN